MQYLLNEEEFKEFVQLRRLKRKMPNEDDLMELCRLAANHIPIERTWTDDTSPWKCILDISPQYCDNCPAKEVCPFENKKWSK